MKKITGLVLAICTQAVFVQTASAQEERAALVPLPSIDDFTRGQDGWGFGLGLSVEYESAYEGSDEFGFELDPAGGVQWRRGDDIFFWAVASAIGQTEAAMKLELWQWSTTATLPTSSLA